MELLVSLTTKADREVCEVLASHSASLAQYQSRGNNTASQDQLLLRSLNVSSGNLLSAPPPLHLRGDLARLPKPPLSPIPPEIMIKSLQKVLDWDCSTYQVSDEEEELDSRNDQEEEDLDSGDDQEEEELGRHTEGEGRAVSSNCCN